MGVHAAAAQDEVAGQSWPGGAHQPVDAAGAGQDAEPDLGQAENRTRVRDPQVRGERQFEPAAEAVPGDGGDRGLGKRRHGLVDSARALVVRLDGLRCHRGQLGRVGTGREDLVPSGDHDRTALTYRRGAERVGQLALQVRRQRIELGLPRQGEDGDLALQPDLDGVFHRGHELARNDSSPPTPRLAISFVTTSRWISDVPWPPWTRPSGPPILLAVDDEAVARPGGRGGDAPRVRAGLRLGDRDGVAALPADVRFEVPFALLGGAGAECVGGPPDRVPQGVRQLAQLFLVALRAGTDMTAPVPSSHTVVPVLANGQTAPSSNSRRFR
jgi:hypothetical protein